MFSIVKELNKPSLKYEVAYNLIKSPIAYKSYRRYHSNPHYVTKIANQLFSRDVGIELEIADSSPFEDVSFSNHDLKYLEKTANSSRFIKNERKMLHIMKNSLKRGAKEVRNYADCYILEYTMRFNINSISALSYALSSLKEKYKVNNGGSIHLHIDFPEYKYSEGQYDVCLPDYVDIINIIRDVFDYKISEGEYIVAYESRNAMIRIKQHDCFNYTMEFRTGYLTTSYSNVMKWILICQNIVDSMAKLQPLDKDFIYYILSLKE